MEVKEVESLEYWKEKAKLTENDSELVKKRCDELESELNQKKSELISMKIALNYTNSFVMRRETELREEVDRLKKQSVEKTERKKKIQKELTNEITTKSNYIDSLLTKLQNLHQSLQYCRETLTQNQEELHETKYWLDIEKDYKEKYRISYETSQSNLKNTKEELEELKIYLEKFRSEKEAAVKVFVESIQDQSGEELEKIRSLYQEEKIKYLKEHNEKQEQCMLMNSEIITKLKKHNEEKIEDLKNYYESRVKTLINQIAQDEGRHLWEINKFLEKIKEINREKYLLGQVNNFLLEKADDKSEELKNIKERLQIIVEEKQSAELNEKIEYNRVKVEFDSIKTKFEDMQKQLAIDYERQINIIQNQNEAVLKSIEDRHKTQIEKLQLETSELSSREKRQFEVQIEFLLEKIEGLETQKSVLESRTIERIETDNHELIDKNQELRKEITRLEEKIETISKETEEKVRKELVSEYKKKIQSRNKKFETVMNNTEIQHSSRVNTITLVFEKKIEEQKKVAVQEFVETEKQYVQKISELQSINQKNHADNHARVKSLLGKIDDQKFEIDLVNRQNFQKQLLINQMDEEFKTRVIFLQNQLKETEELVTRIQKEEEENKEKMLKDFAAKTSELIKKHEKEKTEISEKHLKEKADLEDFYKEKLARKKEKYRKNLTNLNETMGSTIENLSFKLNYKSKILKQQKSEISNLKTHVKYLDNNARLFPSASKSPSSQQKIQFESTKRSYFLRPGSLNPTKKLN